jgi:uncharacterized lipoprotein YajG
MRIIDCSNQRRPRGAAAMVLLAAFTALISGCSTNSVGLKYHPAATPVPFAEQKTGVSVGSFVDQRGQSATWFGAIRGGFGNPLKVLEANTSVANLVQDAFADGLRARGLADGAAEKKYQVAGVIKKFECDQVARREAIAEIEVQVIELASGKQLFSRTYNADNIDGSLMTMQAGVFASVETLRALAEKTLSEIVDKALDDSALRNALR